MNDNKKIKKDKIHCWITLNNMHDFHCFQNADDEFKICNVVTDNKENPNTKNFYYNGRVRKYICTYKNYSAPEYD